jgi:hypothetical protein
MHPWPFIASLVAVTTIFGGTPLAATVKPPCELPPGATTFNHRLPELYKGLVADQARLNPPIEWFNGNCTKGKIEKGSALDQKCGGVQAQSMPQWATYEKARKQYERERAKAIRAAEIAVLDRRLATTKAALQRNAMRGGKLDQDIEEWVALQGEARKQAQEAVLDMGKALLLEKLKRSVDAGLNVAIREDRRMSWIWPSFRGTQLQQQRADVMGRLMAAKNAKDLTTALEWADKAVGTALAGGDAAIARHDREKWAQFLIEVGGVALNDPLAGMIVQDAKLAVPVVYGWAVALSAKERYQEISAIGEAQYADAKRLAALYEKDLKAKNALEKKPVAIESRCS